jgi:uncharacterized protein YoaH (UPF0181 family)
MSDDERRIETGRAVERYRELKATLAALESQGREAAKKLRGAAAALDPQRTHPYGGDTANPFPAERAVEVVTEGLPEGTAVKTLLDELRETFAAKQVAAERLKELGLDLR